MIFRERVRIVIAMNVMVQTFSQFYAIFKEIRATRFVKCFDVDELMCASISRHMPILVFPTLF
jgi:hypothetical protein